MGKISTWTYFLALFSSERNMVGGKNEAKSGPWLLLGSGAWEGPQEGFGGRAGPFCFPGSFDENSPFPTLPAHQ